MSFRTNSTCQPHVVLHNNHHAMVQQAHREMPIPKPWQEKESFSTKHAMEHSRPASTWKDHRWYADNQEQHNTSATCGAGHQQQACGHRARKHQNSKYKTMHNESVDLHHTDHSILTCCKPIQEWQLGHDRQSGKTQHVNHMWCCTTTTMRGCSKHTLKCPSPNHGKTRSHSRPSMLWNTHGLQAHGRRTIDRTPTTRSNTTRQPHVVPDINNKHVAIEQANIKIPRTKQCIMKVWTSTM